MLGDAFREVQQQINASVGANFDSMRKAQQSELRIVRRLAWVVKLASLVTQ